MLYLIAIYWHFILFKNNNSYSSLLKSVETLINKKVGFTQKGLPDQSTDACLCSQQSEKKAPAQS